MAENDFCFTQKQFARRCERDTATHLVVEVLAEFILQEPKVM
jgi:hypothetical protein